VKEDKYPVVLITALLVFASAGRGQPADKNDEKDKMQFKISANYNTGLNYYGRIDSLGSSGFFPLAELWFNKNFYVNAAPVFVHNAISSFEYAGTITSAGFLFKSKDKLLGNIYAVRPFYKESSTLVQSAIIAQTGFAFTLLNKFINFTLGGDVKFSDKTDFGMAAGLDHIFRRQFGEKTVLAINPSAYVYAGTHQFSRDFVKKQGGFLILPPSEQLMSESYKEFDILSYEFSVLTILALGKIQFLFTPAYVIPQNLITIENRPDLSEHGKEMFYATVGLKLSF
jgi:hypothetical protein